MGELPGLIAQPGARAAQKRGSREKMLIFWGNFAKHGASLFGVVTVGCGGIRSAAVRSRGVRIFSAHARPPAWIVADSIEARPKSRRKPSIATCRRLGLSQHTGQRPTRNAALALAAKAPPRAQAAATGQPRPAAHTRRAARSAVRAGCAAPAGVRGDRHRRRQPRVPRLLSALGDGPAGRRRRDCRVSRRQSPRWSALGRAGPFPPERVVGCVPRRIRPRRRWRGRRARTPGDGRHVGRLEAPARPHAVGRDAALDGPSPHTRIGWHPAVAALQLGQEVSGVEIHGRSTRRL